MALRLQPGNLNSITTWIPFGHVQNRHIGRLGSFMLPEVAGKLSFRVRVHPLTINGMSLTHQTRACRSPHTPTNAFSFHTTRCTFDPALRADFLCNEESLEFPTAQTIKLPVWTLGPDGSEEVPACVDPRLMQGS